MDLNMGVWIRFACLDGTRRLHGHWKHIVGTGCQHA